MLILHIIKANIPNLYQSNQEQAITGDRGPRGETHHTPKEENREGEGERQTESVLDGRGKKDRVGCYLSETHTHTHAPKQLYIMYAHVRERGHTYARL